MFNEIDGDFDEVAIRNFKVGLPSEHGLRKSLTGKPITSLRQLELISIRELKMINSKERVRLRLSLWREGISGRTGTITISREGITWDNQDLLISWQLMQCSESLSVKF